MELEWRGATVTSQGEAGPPEPESWEPVAVPGRPSTLAGADAVAYRTTFGDPREHDGQRGLVTVRDAWASATVWLNGQRLVSGDWAGPIRAPFAPMAENELVVVCEAPDGGFGGLEASDAVPVRQRVPSIRGGVDVEAVPRTYVHDLAVRGATDGDEPTIEVEALVDAVDPVDDRLTLSLRPEGFRGGGSMERVPVSADAGERVRVEASLAVRNERRWWPRSLGNQPRYTVSAKLDGHGRTATTGIVDVERDGGDLLINGQRHRPRGVIAPPNADPGTVVEDAIAANATLVRARSHVPSAALADACDEAGLLYWQDLPLVGSGGIDVERGRSLARGLARSRGNHPSLVCWGVHGDPVEPFGTDIGSGSGDRWRFRWRAWRASYDPADAEALAGSLPADDVVFPVTGPIGSDPDAAHLYPGWRYLDAEDVEWLLDRYPDATEVVGAIGAGSLSRPGDESIAGLDVDALSVGADTDPEESRRGQARIVRTVLDALRRREVGTVVIDALRDTDVGGGNGIVTADGERKPAFQAVASAFKPLQAVLDGPPSGGEVGVTVCNDTAEARGGEVAWTAGGRSGRADVEVEAFGRASGGSVPVPDTADRLTLELRCEDVTVSTSYDLTLWR